MSSYAETDWCESFFSLCHYPLFIIQARFEDNRRFNYEIANIYNITSSHIIHIHLGNRNSLGRLCLILHTSPHNPIFMLHHRRILCGILSVRAWGQALDDTVDIRTDEIRNRVTSPSHALIPFKAVLEWRQSHPVKVRFEDIWNSSVSHSHLLPWCCKSLYRSNTYHYSTSSKYHRYS